MNPMDKSPEPTPAISRQPAQELGPRALRTIANILDATRDVFLTSGYVGTTIDEIAKGADISRASFYTYFPSKKEVLVAIGEHAARESATLFDRLGTAGSTRVGMRKWVSDYFEFLDVHGSFAFAWTQGAVDDEEIRTAGMKRHLKLCKKFGDALAATAGKNRDDAQQLGLVMTSTLERSWSYCQVYGDAIDVTDIKHHVADVMWDAARAKPKA